MPDPGFEKVYNQAFASFLLTEPVDNSADQVIRVELVDITGRFGRGTLDLLQRDDVQLYR